MTKTLPLAFLGFVILTACTRPAATPPTPTQPVFVIPTLISAETPASTLLTLTPPPAESNICTDPQVTALIDSLKSSMLNSDGALLGRLVHPGRGMEVRWVRNGNAITYTREQAKFLFETTFEANWGAEPGSGLDKIGAFHDVIVPELVEIFNLPYSLHCNELEHGGASYELVWPYEGNYYSIFFPGTEQYGLLDWHTWAIGIEYENGKPFIYALMQFFWEP